MKERYGIFLSKRNKVLEHSCCLIVVSYFVLGLRVKSICLFGIVQVDVDPLVWNPKYIVVVLRIEVF